MVPPVALSEMHMDPPDPLPYLGDHLVLGELPASAIDGFVAAAGPGSGSSLISAEIRHRAALSPEARRGTVRSTSSPARSSCSPSAWCSTKPLRTRRTPISASAELAAAHRAGSYLNFEESQTDAASFYEADVYRRLRQVKAAVDPNEVFRANHRIPPAR